MHQEWGLNRPLISQYWLFLDRLLHGNLGQSLYYGVSASSLILQQLPATLWLIVYAAVLAVADQRAAGDARGQPQGRRSATTWSGWCRCSGWACPPFWVGLSC